MFIWTISDSIGVVFGTIAAIWFGFIFLLIKLEDRRVKRLRAKSAAGR